MLDKLSLYAHKNKINKRRKTADITCLKHTVKGVVTVYSIDLYLKIAANLVKTCEPLKVPETLQKFFKPLKSP